LNFIGHLSGIATLTRCFVEKVKHTHCKIIDTRKTLPAYRDLEKKAVVNGGGQNHRMGLSDAILIKENHITVAGGLSKAVERVRQHSKEKIEVECATLDDVKEAVRMKVERILLDNMSNDLIAQSLKLMPDEMLSEASGNMKLDRVQSVAELGVDYISVGAITHSAPTADVSLLFDWQASEMAPI
jgi:nicotinate-nucleotide pyrophosphorylase (carboxylating)